MALSGLSISIRSEIVSINLSSYILSNLLTKLNFYFLSRSLIRLIVRYSNCFSQKYNAAALGYIDSTCYHIYLIIVIIPITVKHLQNTFKYVYSI